MRMMMKVSIPVEPGNRAIKEGILPKTVQTFVDQVKPEAIYFVAEDGMRTGYFFFDLKEPAMIPSMCEPFFMNLGASIELAPAMNVEDMKSGVARAMKPG